MAGSPGVNRNIVIATLLSQSPVIAYGVYDNAGSPQHN